MMHKTKYCTGWATRQCSSNAYYDMAIACNNSG